MRRWSLLLLFAACALGASACGGDNLDLCDGCAAATVTPTVTSTSTTATPQSTATPNAFGIATSIFTPGA